MTRFSQGWPRTRHTNYYHLLDSTPDGVNFPGTIVVCYFNAQGFRVSMLKITCAKSAGNSMEVKLNIKVESSFILKTSSRFVGIISDIYE